MLAEVDELADSVEVVSICTLLSGGSVSVFNDVAQEGSVTDFLICHELDKGDAFSVDTSIGELLGGESLDT